MSAPSTNVAALVDLLTQCGPNGLDYPVNNPILIELGVPEPPPATRPIGAVYTPPQLVDQALSDVLKVGDMPASVVDPACGAGAFLVGALRRMASTPAARAQALTRLQGFDACPRALAIARTALALAVLEVAVRPWSPITSMRFARVSDSVRLRQVDSLHDLADEGHYELVIGNPPWEDAASMCLRDATARAAIAPLYTSATGNWDLFCPFTELALRLCAPQGRLALILPDKVAQATYAAGIRGLLEPHLDKVCRLDSDAFDAAIHPVLIVARKRHEGAGSQAPWSLDGELDSPEGWRPTGEWCQVFGAATVSEAYAFQALLIDKEDPGPNDLRMVNTGTIDPLTSHWGRRPLRYLGRSLNHPVIPEERTDQLPKKRLTQARTPKVVVAGLTLRLEALADPHGRLIPGKSTVVVVPPKGVPPEALAALLCAPSVTKLWKHQYSALALQNGYLRVGPPQIRALKLPELVPGSTLTVRLTALGRRASERGFSTVEALLDEAIREA